MKIQLENAKNAKKAQATHTALPHTKKRPRRGRPRERGGRFMWSTGTIEVNGIKVRYEVKHFADHQGSERICGD